MSSSRSTRPTSRSAGSSSAPASRSRWARWFIRDRDRQQPADASGQRDREVDPRADGSGGAAGDGARVRGLDEASHAMVKRILAGNQPASGAAVGSGVAPAIAPGSLCDRPERGAGGRKGSESGASGREGGDELRAGREVDEFRAGREGSDFSARDGEGGERGSSGREGSKSGAGRKRSRRRSSPAPAVDPAAPPDSRLSGLFEESELARRRDAPSRRWRTSSARLTPRSLRPTSRCPRSRKRSQGPAPSSFLPPRGSRRKRHRPAASNFRPPRGSQPSSR